VIETTFEWDDAKNLSNERKHGIRFELAVLAFSTRWLSPSKIEWKVAKSAGKH
jgi:uncharacterized DUF497 family protein